MSLAQENFDRAQRSGSSTIRLLHTTLPINLDRESTKTLQTWMWDLEAIQAAIRLELMNRETVNPVDLG